MKLLRKYAWRLVNALLSIVTILAAYHQFWLSRPTRALQVVADTPISLVDIRPEAVGDIEVLFRGELVNSVSLLQVHIRNSGNQPITEDDYSRPLSFSFAAGSTLADVDVTGSEPSNIGMVVTVTSECEAEMSPTLLNPGDTVDVRFILVGASSESVLQDFAVDARIAGIRGVDVSWSQAQQPPTGPLVVAAVVGVVLSLFMGVLTEKVIARPVILFFQGLSSFLSTLLVSREKLVVYSAQYGAQGIVDDVTGVLRSKVSKGQLELPVTNAELGGDPIKGVKKQLDVVYSYAGQMHTTTIPEGKTLRLPQPEADLSSEGCG